MSFAGLDAYLREVVGRDPGVPGAVVLVRQGSRKVFHEAYGYAQTLPCRVGMRRDTLFDLASLTKPVCTGLVAMRLWQDGALALERGLSFWFPTPQDSDKARITVRHLLCNRSGLPAWRPLYAGVPARSCPVPAETVRGKILAEPLIAAPGTREIYSDLGFMLLGWILERQADTGLAELFREKIVAPLGLGRVGFRGIPGEHGGGDVDPQAVTVAATERCPWRHRVLRGEVHDENGYLIGGVGGHAGLFAPAEDLDRVVQEIFRGWRGDSDVFSHAGLHTFLVRTPDPAVAGTWALGWDTPTPDRSTSGRYFSAESCGHTGFTGTSLWIDLARQVAVILLTNRVHPSRDNETIRVLRPRVHDLIMEALLRTRTSVSVGLGPRTEGPRG